MSTEIKELPEHFAIKKQSTNPLWISFIEWINSKFKRDYEGHKLCYSVSKSETDWYKEVHDLPNKFKLITLEQWDEIVNGKEEFGDISDILEYSKGKTYKSEVNGCITDNSGDKQHQWNETTPTAKYFKRIIKQPRLKVGDRVPEYLDGKLSFKGNGYGHWHNGFILANEYEVTKIDAQYYFYQNPTDPGYLLKISEVDALIEQHERESKLPFPNQLAKKVHEEMIQELESQPKEEWIPKNGEEVEGSYNDVEWYLLSYIGKSQYRRESLWILEDKAGSIGWFKSIRKPIEYVTKRYSEVLDIAAQALDISIEQLKIVEG